MRGDHSPSAQLSSVSVHIRRCHIEPTHSASVAVARWLGVVPIVAGVVLAYYAPKIMSWYIAGVEQQLRKHGFEWQKPFVVFGGWLWLAVVVIVLITLGIIIFLGHHNA